MPQDPINYLLDKLNSSVGNGPKSYSPRANMGAGDMVKRFFGERRRRDINLPADESKRDKSLSQRDPKQIIARVLGGK